MQGQRGRRIRLRRLASRFINLFKHPLFWILTFMGNGTVMAGGFLLYHFEASVQSVPIGLLDANLWALGMVTTVGYGPWTPLTFGGKLTAGVLMLVGTLFVWSYMAFLVTGLITPELSSLESDVHAMERKIRNLQVDLREEVSGR